MTLRGVGRLLSSGTLSAALEPNLLQRLLSGPLRFEQLAQEFAPELQRHDKRLAKIVSRLIPILHLAPRW